MGQILPKGWVETEFGLINQKSSPKNIKPFEFPDKEFESYSVPIFVEGKPEIVKGSQIRSSKQIVEEGDILVCKINPRINRVWVVGNFSNNMKIASSEWIVINNSNINSDYLKYQFQSERFRTLIQSEVSGVGGSLTRARPKIVNRYPVYISPLAEQERIVSKIDKLFAQYDKIKKALELIPQLLKDFRKKVLTHAVIGKPTPLNDLGIWKGGGTPSKSKKEYWENGDILWITAKDMKALFLKDSFDKITLKGLKESSANLIPKNSILIVTRSGILRRILPISTNELDSTVNQDLKVLVPKEEYFYKYLVYALNCKEEDIRNQCMKSGTTVESIEFNTLKNYKLPIPTYKEQQEIVSHIESLFDKADIIERRYRKLKNKLNTLPQAILHKAFKGELVTQHPTDADAKDLLKAILALRKDAKGRRKHELNSL